MLHTFSTYGLKALLVYPFSKAGWLSKLGILGILALLGLFIPLIPWIFAAGYLTVLLQAQIVEGSSPELPDWSNWGQLFIKGLRLYGVSLFYCVPVALIFGVGITAYMASFFTMFAAGNLGHDGIAALMVPLGMSVMMASFGIGMALSLGLGLLYPAPLAHVVSKESFAALFHVRDWWRIFRANLGGYVVIGVFLLGIFMAIQLASQVLFYSLAGFFLFPFLMLAAAPYIGVIWVMLIGTAYREGVELNAQRLVEGNQG